MNTKIIASLIAISTVAAAAGAATMAYFSDVETSTGNTFAAGTLDLTNTITGTASDSSKVAVTEAGDGLNDSVVFSNLKPGENGILSWTLSNTGSLSGVLTTAVAYTSDENDLVEPETGDNGDDDNGADLDGELDEKMVLVLKKDGNVIVTNGTIADVEAKLEADSETLVAKNGSTVDSVVYAIEWSLPYDAVGNEIQSDDLGLDVTFTLKQ